LIQHDCIELHTLTRAEGGNGGFRIPHDHGSPAFPASECGDEAALGRLIVNQHEQSLLEICHNASDWPQGNPLFTAFLVKTGKEPIKARDKASADEQTLEPRGGAL
jgi:hypothetical protein